MTTAIFRFFFYFST
ncbi:MULTISPECIES: pheST operon leader peptide PheM [Symbiopectobacterium]|uniref:pheST attenuator peptide n=1 Tax=Symbiopectobacterium purcellii TaxID=2871826 RepID=A0ABX9ASM0_9ENTR|nr:MULTISPECIES: pheST operon leader peptide PheM [Symbiopectobacterium]NLS43380.1 pheST operon leader peptide PheM [Candidatus Symbiopectobacterium sp. Chty_BC]MCW2473695.1 pheST operon leader peptide PheM [Candidatus Symbiopectobacterium sp. NZEC151]MCW2479704.1 pheST operon leader peptide PheM [Candidatus Symbiopectobacterium sp. NZEC135]MCW2484895.1 pheST operon leader peptide PheM [Candidatus Symbiopectobacterium sp. NZEC127]QZN98033.1 pheST operon leader peptide PheM [Symbiopectobacteriu